MLKLKPRRVDPWYVTALLPMPVVDALKMMSPALAIGGLASILTKDVGVLLLALALGYFCVVLIGRKFVQYRVSLRNNDDFLYVVDLLNKTATLEKEGDKLIWRRRGWPNFLRSKVDEISIYEDNSKWIVQGRRYDMLSVASALSSR